MRDYLCPFRESVSTNGAEIVENLVIIYRKEITPLEKGVNFYEDLFSLPF